MQTRGFGVAEYVHHNGAMSDMTSAQTGDSDDGLRLRYIGGIPNLTDKERNDLYSIYSESAYDDDGNAKVTDWSVAEYAPGVLNIGVDKSYSDDDTRSAKGDTLAYIGGLQGLTDEQRNALFALSKWTAYDDDGNPKITDWSVASYATDILVAHNTPDDPDTKKVNEKKNAVIASILAIPNITDAQRDALFAMAGYTVVNNKGKRTIDWSKA